MSFLPSVLRSLAICVLTTFGSLLTYSLIPPVYGWHAAVITSGSMSPSLRPGDIVVYSPLTGTAPVVGTILVFDSPAHPGTLISHRLVRIDPARGLIVKGDANPAEDSDPVPPANVRGVARQLIPYVGRSVLFRTPSWRDGVATMAGLVVAAAVLLMTGEDKRSVPGRHRR